MVAIDGLKVKGVYGGWLKGTVHTEVVHSLTTDSFLNAFRFVALRGSVRQIRCDQGTNLVGAKSELLKLGCDMIFNPPAGSHRGGVWERMIGAASCII